MASLFLSGGAPAHAYHTPTSHANFAASFELASDDDDDDDENRPVQAYNHHGNTATSTVQPFRLPPTASHNSHPSASPSAPPLASSSSSYSHSSTGGISLPGSYDFEPQADPVFAPPPATGPPSVPNSTRPSLSFSRQPRAPSFAPSFGAAVDDESERYGRRGGLRDMLQSRLGAFLRGQPASSSAAGAGQGGGSESHGLLFSQDDSDETDAEGGAERSGSSSYPPAPGGGRNIHLPLPARAPQFGTPAGSAGGGAGAGGAPSAPGGRVYGSGSGNDGVFANLSAKPDNPGGLDVIGEGPDKDEILPTYDDANRDTTPPYWETTVLTPGGPFSADDIIVDGLPVGNFFSFAWNLLVSMSFQFVGFLLTYLLHTTHAAKNGSRAGLGITLIQLGFYLKQRTDGYDPSAPGDSTGLNGAPGPSSSSDQTWSWWGSDDSTSPSPTTTALGSLPTQFGAALSSALEASDPSQTGAARMPSLMGDGVGEQEMVQMSEQANEWMAFLMVTVGSFLLIGGCLSYWRAVRWARALRAGGGPGATAA
ncbi:hypothetical protein JCM8547_000940 [Rhodosporidiobolus lusitaniae]